ncbi:hypothetical protein V8E55_005298 [Tylopilus felleus]
MSTSQLFAISGPIYASFFFGTLLTTAFYGVVCMQTYDNDPLGMKIFVATMWAIQSVHEALSVSAVYKYIMAGLDSPSSFLNGNPELIALVAAPTQCFFIYRLYVFSNGKIVAPLVLVRTMQFNNLNKLSKYQYHILLLGTISFSIAAGIDVLIAIFMTFLLIRQRIATGFAGTAHMLQLLAIFAVNTGIWTATFALLIIILLHLFPDKAYYSIFVIPLGSVYCNTLLANLNVRTYLKGAGSTFTVDISLSSARSTLRVLDRAEDNRQTKVLSSGVWKTTETVVFSDGNRSTTAENTCNIETKVDYLPVILRDRSPCSSGGEKNGRMRCVYKSKLLLTVQKEKGSVRGQRSVTGLEYLPDG